MCKNLWKICEKLVKICKIILNNFENEKCEKWLKIEKKIVKFDKNLRKLEKKIGKSENVLEPPIYRLLTHINLTFA